MFIQCIVSKRIVKRWSAKTDDAYIQWTLSGYWFKAYQFPEEWKSGSYFNNTTEKRWDRGIILSSIQYKCFKLTMVMFYLNLDALITGNIILHFSYICGCFSECISNLLKNSVFTISWGIDHWLKTVHINWKPFLFL